MESIPSAYTEDAARSWNFHLSHKDGMPDEKRDGEFDFFRNLARESGGPVLELASGAARVTSAIAQVGIEVYGLEASEAMLAKAREIIGTLPEDAQKRVRLIQGDMRRFSLEKQVPLIIIPFCSFWFNFRRAPDGEKGLYRLWFEKQAEACVDSMVRALVPGGRFVVDTPEFDAYGEWWGRMASQYNFTYEVVTPYMDKYTFIDYVGDAQTRGGTQVLIATKP